MDQGNTAFLLIAAALVLLMTPGLAFFYGGLVKAKSVISMMMLSFGAMGLIGVLWVLYGYAITFSNAGVGNFVGIDGVLGIDLDQLGLQGAFNEATSGDITTAYPTLAFAAFQATFAIITVALISGAIADRAKFGAWMVFAGVWATVVYFPVASWVFNFTVTKGTITDGGWIAYLVVRMTSPVEQPCTSTPAPRLSLWPSCSASESTSPRGVHKPHNPPFVLLGAGLLWFGWFGFNAGSELAADGIAAVAFLNTIAAPAAGILGWLIVEKIKDGKPTSVGAASGAVAGLVAITPAGNILTPFWAIVLGILVGAICAIAIDLKFKLGFDDSLDVVGIHLIGGLIGTLYIGLLGNNVGLFFGFGGAQLGKQAIAAFAVLIYSFVLSYAIALIIEKTMGFRVKNEDEIAGIDTVMHGEEGYILLEETR